MSEFDDMDDAEVEDALSAATNRAADMQEEIVSLRARLARSNAARQALSDSADYLNHRLAAEQIKLARIKAILADPLAVHLNMMRGTIQWTPANLYHLLGQEPPNSPETA